VDFPCYDGKSEPHVLIINYCKSYFRRERIMAEEKVWMASCHLEDGARTWFLQVREEGTPAWHHFTKLLCLRFGLPQQPTPTTSDGHHHTSELLDSMLALLRQLADQIERMDRRRRAAARIQAAARGLLARRRAHVLCAAKASEEQAAVRLQAAVRGFLV
jgi:hypothetical protein